MRNLNKKILCAITMYNCEKHILKTLDQIKDSNDLFHEIIIIDNQSSDLSVNIAKEYLNNIKNPKFKILVNQENFGLGGSHKVIFNYGLKNNFDAVIVFHGDNQGKIKDIYPVFKLIDFETNAAVLGSRFMKGSKIIGYSKFRVFGNYIFNMIYSLITLNKITDMGSGLNIYILKNLPENFFNMPNDLTFNNAFILNLIACKKKLIFFPISWLEDGQISNAKLFTQSMYLLKYAFYYLLGKNMYKNKIFYKKNNFTYKTNLIFNYKKN